MVHPTVYNGHLSFTPSLTAEQLELVTNFVVKLPRLNCIIAVTPDELTYSDETKQRGVEDLFAKLVPDVLIPNQIVASGELDYYNDGDCSQARLVIENNRVSKHEAQMMVTETGDIDIVWLPEEEIISQSSRRPTRGEG